MYPRSWLLHASVRRYCLGLFQIHTSFKVHLNLPVAPLPVDLTDGEIIKIFIQHTRYKRHRILDRLGSTYYESRFSVWMQADSEDQVTYSQSSRPNLLCPNYYPDYKPYLGILSQLPSILVLSGSTVWVHAYDVLGIFYMCALHFLKMFLS